MAVKVPLEPAATLLPERRMVSLANVTLCGRFETNGRLRSKGTPRPGRQRR